MDMLRMADILQKARLTRILGNYTVLCRETVFKHGTRHVLEESDTRIGAGNELTPSLTSRSREADAQVAPSK